VVNEGREVKGYAFHNGHMIASESENIESHGEESRNDCVNAYHAYDRDRDRTSGSENDAFRVLGWECEISERLMHLQISIRTGIERDCTDHTSASQRLEQPCSIQLGGRTLPNRNHQILLEQPRRLSVS
jgi:hypothetical protein